MQPNLRDLNQRSLPARNPLCVALDVDSRERALYLVEELYEIIGAVKLGPRLIHRYGESLVREIAAKIPVFIDCKFFDIPSTMVAAVRASFDAGASFVTVHALAGCEALEQLAKLEQLLNRERPFRILCVTILTSWGQENLPSVIKAQSISQSVFELAELVKKSGLRSIVSSAEELPLVKSMDLFVVTPGIRFSDQEKDDQKRVMDPAQAIQAGSSLLVVGRPILEAKIAKETALDFLTAIYANNLSLV